MNKERFAERMLENENLTDALEDADANWLLNWGTGKLDRALSGIQDDEAAGERANALMALMRQMNRITGSYSEKSPTALAEDLAALRALAAAAFPQAAAPGAPIVSQVPQAAEAGGLPETNTPPEADNPSAATRGGKLTAAESLPAGEQRIRPAETGFRPLRSLMNWFRRWQEPAADNLPQAINQPKVEESPAVEVKSEPAAASQPDLSAEAARLAAMSPRDVLQELSKLIGEG